MRKLASFFYEDPRPSRSRKIDEYSEMMSGKFLTFSRRFQSVNWAKQGENFTTRIQKYHSKWVDASDENGIRFITLNNPSQRNVLSEDVLRSLQFNLENESEKVHCVVIRATGKVFSAGHDLKELTSETKENHRKLFDLCSRVMLAIQRSPVPVVAMVGGHAAAAGCQLAASCDIVVAGESAQFSTPGINVGLFCSTPGIALARAVPRKVAAYMLFTGLPISAKDAVLSGLVSRAVPDDKLEEETMKVAKTIAEKSKPVQTLGKEFLARQMEELSAEKAYEMGSKVMAANLALKDAQGGLKAFAEKKKPSWSHTTEKAH